jgi:pimeloyl-ACP methyl ester carboxylesterase
MDPIPFTKPAYDSEMTPGALESETMNWIGFAAGGTLVAAGLLLLAGERRAGMVAAAAGTALAMLDQQETLQSWWNALPGYIDQVQGVLGKVQNTVNDVADKRETLRQVLAR